MLCASRFQLIAFHCILAFCLLVCPRVFFIVVLSVSDCSNLQGNQILAPLPPLSPLTALNFL